MERRNSSQSRHRQRRFEPYPSAHGPHGGGPRGSEAWGGLGGGPAWRGPAAPPPPPRQPIEAHLVFVVGISAEAEDEAISRFFRACGPITAVAIPRDPSGACRGFAYVEFGSEDAVAEALELTGRELLGSTISVTYPYAEKRAVAEKERAEQASKASAGHHPSEQPPGRLYLGNVPWSVSANDLTAVLASYGKVESLVMLKDPQGNRPHRGVGFVTYPDRETAARAMEKIGELQLMGRNVVCRFAGQGKEEGPRKDPAVAAAARDGDDSEAPEQLAPDARAALAAKLRKGSIESEYLMLKNMFELSEVESDSERQELEEDIRGECEKFGAVVQIVLDRKNPIGRVFVQFEACKEAENARKSLNQRWFGEKQIEADLISAEEIARIDF